METIAESLAKAARDTEDHRKAYRAATSKLLDGTEISGWEKTTVCGDVFWLKGRRFTLDIIVEAGAKKVDAALGQA